MLHKERRALTTLWTSANAACIKGTILHFQEVPQPHPYKLPGKITGGASGALRQEFRELELLDDITRLRFEDKLPSKVTMADR
jgi:hypothetical protein